MDWFPWYYKLYKKATMHLDPYQDGCYRRLIDHYMETRSPLPDNDVALARIVGDSLGQWVGLASATVRPFFEARNGLLFHERCDRELDKQDQLSKKLSESGRKGAEKRHNKNIDIPSPPLARAKPTPKASRSTIQYNTGQDSKKDTITPSAFDEAWAIYPKQRIGGRSKALTAWQSALSRKHTEKTLIEGVKNYATSDEVNRGFAKGFAAWLNDDRFLNDYTKVAKPSGSAARGNGGFDALAVATGQVQKDMENIELRTLAKTNYPLYLQRMLDKSRGGNSIAGSPNAPLIQQPDAASIGVGDGQKG